MTVTIEDIRALQGEVSNTNGSLAEARKMLTKDIRTLQSEVSNTNDSLADARELLYELVKYTVEAKEEWKQRVEESRQESERKTAEIDRQITVANADRKRMNDFQEKLSQKLGTLVEDFVAPDMRRIMHLVSGCPVEDISEVYVRQKRRLSHDKGQHLEVDAYVECGDLVLINETKENMTAEYIDGFIKKQLTRFREFFPEYKDYKLWGCVSSFRIESSLVKYANRQGLITLALSDGLMQTQDAPDFKPKTF
jgi:DNA-binding transcriptional MerR regulator